LNLEDVRQSVGLLEICKGPLCQAAYILIWVFGRVSREGTALYSSEFGREGLFGGIWNNHTLPDRRVHGTRRFQSQDPLATATMTLASRRRSCVLGRFRGPVFTFAHHRGSPTRSWLVLVSAWSSGSFTCVELRGCRTGILSSAAWGLLLAYAYIAGQPHSARLHQQLRCPSFWPFWEGWYSGTSSHRRARSATRAPARPVVPGFVSLINQEIGAAQKAQGRWAATVALIAVVLVWACATRAPARCECARKPHLSGPHPIRVRPRIRPG